MIGLSLSRCVSDILDRIIDLENVEKIYTGTACTTEFDWRMLIKEYSLTCWKKRPKQARRVFGLLVKEGKIFQPRLSDHRKPSTEFGRWVDNESEIHWIPC